MFSNLSSTTPHTTSLCPDSSPSEPSSPPLTHPPSPKADHHLAHSPANSLHNPVEADPDADWTVLSQYSTPFAIGDICSLHEQALSEPNLDLDIVRSQSALSHPAPDRLSSPPAVPASSAQVQPSSEPQPHDPAMVQCQQWLSNLPLAEVLCKASIDADQDASDVDQVPSMSASRNYAPSQIQSDLGPDDSLSVVCGRPIIDRHRTITPRAFSNAHAPPTGPIEISQLTITPHAVSKAQVPPLTSPDATRPTATQRALVNAQVPPTLAETPLDYSLDPLMDLSSSYLHPAILPSFKSSTGNLDTQLPSSGPVATQDNPPTQAAASHDLSTQDLIESAVDPFGPLTDRSASSSDATDRPAAADPPQPRGVRRPSACLRLVFTAGFAALVALLSLWLQWRPHPDQLGSAQGVPSIASPSFVDLEDPTLFPNSSLASSSSEALSASHPKHEGPSSHDSQDFSAPDPHFPTVPPPRESPNIDPMPESEAQPSLYSPCSTIKEDCLSLHTPPNPEPLSAPTAAAPPASVDHPNPSNERSPTPTGSEHGDRQSDDEQPPGPAFSIPWGFVLVGLGCFWLPRLVAVNPKQEQDRPKRQDGLSVDYIITRLESVVEDAHTSPQAFAEALRATACSPGELKRLTDVLERRMRTDVYTRVELGLLAWATGARGDDCGADTRWRRFWSEEAKADLKRPVVSKLVDKIAREWAAGRAGDEGGMGPAHRGPAKGPPLKGRSRSPAVQKALRLKKSCSPAPRAEVGGEDESGSDSTVLPARRGGKKATTRTTKVRHSEPVKLTVVKVEEVDDDKQEEPSKVPSASAVTKSRGRASDGIITSTAAGPTRSSPRIRATATGHATTAGNDAGSKRKK